MRFLISIASSSELKCYEAIALAFTLASFDHEVQLNFHGDSLIVLQDATSRLFGMVQSLELYDLPKAYHQFGAAVSNLDDQIQAVLTDGKPDADAFDTLLNF